MVDRFEHFTKAIFSISRCWNKIASEEMKKHGLKGTNAFYLITLHNNKEIMTATKLASVCQRDKADVSRAMRAFRESGILEPETESGYRTPLILTKKGCRLAKAISERAADVLGVAGEGISDENRTIMYECLDKISGHLQELCRDGEKN